jgi:hypothetical protein
MSVNGSESALKFHANSALWIDVIVCVCVCVCVYVYAVCAVWLCMVICGVGMLCVCGWVGVCTILPYLE